MYKNNLNVVHKFLRSVYILHSIFTFHSKVLQQLIHYEVVGRIKPLQNRIHFYDTNLQGLRSGGGGGIFQQITYISCSLLAEGNDREGQNVTIRRLLV